MKIERFEDIEGWKLARELTRLVYSVTKQPDFSKDFGLKEVWKRGQEPIAKWPNGCSALLVPDPFSNNIAEGVDGGSDSEFVRFLRYAPRSCTEVKSQLYAALDQIYITQQQFDEIYEQATQTHKCIGGFIRDLTNRND